MLTPRSVITTAVLAVALAAPAAAAQAATRAPIKDCGDVATIDSDHVLAKAGDELTLVHCENQRQTSFIRFEFGS